jgi:hypothetical protein
MLPGSGRLVCGSVITTSVLDRLSWSSLIVEATCGNDHHPCRVNTLVLA